MYGWKKAEARMYGWEQLTVDGGLCVAGCAKCSPALHAADCFLRKSETRVIVREPLSSAGVKRYLRDGFRAMLVKLLLHAFIVQSPRPPARHVL